MTNLKTDHPGSLRWILAVVLVLVAVAGLAASFVFWPRPPKSNQPPLVVRQVPEDPRLTYTGPFRNISPDVAYMGDDSCMACHPGIVNSFRRHRKGQNFMAVTRQPKPPAEDPAHHNPFEAFGARFQVERDGEHVRHRRTSLAQDEAGQPIYDTALDVAIAVGSWTNGFSYLGEQDGYVYQTPISWYSQKNLWDVSPGFGPDLLPGRPVPEACLYCHANCLIRPMEGYRNRFKAPVFGGLVISCERCHGPGQLHVLSHREGEGVAGIDHTIVNPKHLNPVERDDVCQQCHLVGTERVEAHGRKKTDYRPGLPLRDFLAIFVPPPGPDAPNKAVTQVEFMRLSRCYIASDGKLGCLTCHDSHVYREPEQRRVYYRQACLTCHADKGSVGENVLPSPLGGEGLGVRGETREEKPGFLKKPGFFPPHPQPLSPKGRGETKPCSLPVAERLKQIPSDSCTDCHMPRYSVRNIPHTASTDHRILRRPSSRTAPTGQTVPVAGGSPPIVQFQYTDLDPRDPEVGRNLGIALAAEVSKGMAPLDWGAYAVTLLEMAIARDPEDWPAWNAKAEILTALGRHADALAALEIILAQTPREEVALGLAAQAATNMNLQELAETYWRRAIEMNPRMVRYRAQLTVLLLKRRAWEEALTQTDFWLNLDPSSIEGRLARINALLRTGHKEQARAEFTKVKALKPGNLKQLESWFTKDGN